MEVLGVPLCLRGLHLRLDIKVTTSQLLHLEATAGVIRVANLIMEARNQEDTEPDQSLMVLDQNTRRSV